MARPGLPGERAVWHAVHSGVGSALHVCRAIEMHGSVDADALAVAITLVAEQAPPCALRYQGSPYDLTVAASDPAPVVVEVWECADTGNVDARAKRERFARLSFDLTAGQHLRVLLQVSPECVVLVGVAHHLAFDGPSLDRLIYHALRRYCGQDTGPFAGFRAVAARKFDGAERWRSLELADARQERPFRGAVDDARKVAVFQREVPADVAALKRAARAASISVAHALLTLFAATIHAVADDSDLLFITPVDIRSRIDRQALGMGVNALAVRSKLAEGVQIDEFAVALRRVFLRAYQLRNDPLTDIVETSPVARRVDGSSWLTDYEFNYAPAWRPPSCLAEAGISAWSLDHLVPEAQYDVRLSAIDTAEHGISLCWQVRGGAEAKNTARILCEAFANLARAWCESGRASVTSTDVVGGETGRALVRAGCGPVRDVDLRSVTERFLDQTTHRATATAVRSAASTVTYAELRHRVLALAGRLTARGIGPRDRVAVYVSRDVELVTVMLAIWAIGGVYVPIERSNPDSRVSAMLAAVRPALVVTTPEANTALTGIAGSLPTVVLGTQRSRDDHEAGAAGHADRLVPFRYRELRDPAYVIFTSGSTGTPKAVEIHLGGMLNHLEAKIEAGGLSPSDVFAQLAPMSFDVHIWQLMAPLVTGGTLRIFTPEELRDPVEFSRLARRDRITALQAVPSYLESWSHIAATANPADGNATDNCGIPGLRVLYSTGEAFPAALTPTVRTLFPSAVLVNAYGPAEGSDNVTHHVIGSIRTDDTIVPIGKPIANARLYVLDRWRRLRPPGLRGELAIGGLSVGNGYVTPSARAVFHPDPWLASANMYLTGDQGSLTNGLFFYHGRNDTQVKLAGRRVELGEIENACMSLPGVSAAAVSVMRVAGSQSLIGFVVGPTEESATLRKRLRQILPGYMIPERLLIVDQIPLTANGKVDRAMLLEWAESLIALRTGHGEIRDQAAGQLESRQEVMVKSAWESALGHSDLDSTANFFGLGGDSLKAMQMIVSLRKSGMRADVTQLYEAPILGEFTDLVIRPAPPWL